MAYFYTGGYLQKWGSQEQKNESNVRFQGLFWDASDEHWTERVSIQLSTLKSTGLLVQFSQHIPLHEQVQVS